MAYNAIFKSDDETISFALRQLEIIYNDAMEQSRGWSRSSRVAAGVGFVLIGLSVAFATVGFPEKWLLTTIASLIPSAVAALFFRQGRAANQRVDVIGARLLSEYERQAAVAIADTIEDQKLRDKVKVSLSERNFGSKRRPNGKKK